MSDIKHVLVGLKEPTKASIHSFGSSSKDALEDGQVLVHVVKVVITANTMTYAIAGENPALKYFGHYRVPEGPDMAQYARTPAWGTGVVVASKCPDVAEGMRIHGFFTLSQMVVLTPTEITESGFVDGAPHRKDMYMVYKQFTNHEDPSYKGLAPDEEDWKMSDGMLFSTGWTMAKEAEIHAAEPSAILLTSASSRTAFSAAFSAKFHGSKLKVIGLTSPGNVDYTKGLGVYDVVCSYDEVESLEKEKVAMYDLSGNGKVQESVYKHFGDQVIHCGQVGGTHADVADFGKFETHGGVKPQSWLVITAIQAFYAPLGQDEVHKQLAAAEAAYKERAMKSLKVERRFGPEAVTATWQEVAEGKAPKCVVACSLWPESEHEPLRSSSAL